MSTPSLDVRDAPQLAQPRVGLLAAAKQVDLSADVRWGNGVQWLPELHPVASHGFGARALKCQPSSIAHTSTDRATIESAKPFMIYAFDWSTSLDHQPSGGRDWEGRARRLLLGTQSYSIAAELWLGTIAQAESLAENYYLAKTGPTVVTSGAVRADRALAVLDKKLAGSLMNGQGMIHCTVEVLDQLVHQQTVVRDGQAWMTPFGNVVVADGGYAGSRIGAAGEWMVGTSLVEITLGQPDVMRTSTPEEWRAAFDYTVNDVIVWAQREVLVMHHPHIVFAAAQVDLTA